MRFVLFWQVWKEFAAGRDEKKEKVTEEVKSVGIVNVNTELEEEWAEVKKRRQAVKEGDRKHLLTFPPVKMCRN